MKKGNYNPFLGTLGFLGSSNAGLAGLACFAGFSGLAIGSSKNTNDAPAQL